MKLETGKIHVYTGNGKGKTTAAIGLAIRAAGAGLGVFIAQFIKKNGYSELKALREFGSRITLEQYGTGCFILKEPAPPDIAAARQGLEKVREVLCGGDYPLVILDEACVALYFKLFSVEELLDALNSRPENVEVVLTGRYAPEALIHAADLVTEMKEVKHYYTQGLAARTGIEK